MRISITVALLIASLAFALPGFAAKTPQESAIAARQGLMHLRAFNLGPLIGMIKRDIPYDAEQASIAANNLKTLLAMDMRAAWMEGTSHEAYPDKTDALPAIWAADSDFAQHGEEFADAVKRLAAVAGDGLDTMAPAAKKLAQSCKGCHDDYRAD